MSELAAETAINHVSVSDMVRRTTVILCHPPFSSEWQVLSLAPD